MNNDYSFLGEDVTHWTQSIRRGYAMSFILSSFHDTGVFNFLKDLSPKSSKEISNKLKLNKEILESGLNFLVNAKLERNFLLLCGFEKFKDFFVRIDILEKLFIKIIDNTKDRKFKINSSMMNLLGCSKENFFKLMNYMNYKKDKEEDTYIFKGEKKKKEKLFKFDNKENPFNKLRALNIK